jgi:FKBP-type peptidyl-prolyl cis-trans isomerase|tara:strand:+ start:1944 stop:2306 length:363 start_codon:yes stop_codon:yes gene_type:complete
MPKPLSEQTKIDALKVAKGIQKPGQTKEQTKIISQGIEKGIALYKQQQKAKAREADKQRKLELKAKQKTDETAANNSNALEKCTTTGRGFSRYLPWGLLVISWAGFIGFQIFTNASLASL